MGFIFQEMAERVTNGPRTANELLDMLLPPEPFQAARMVFRQRMVVPANGPAHRNAIRVDAAGGMVSCGNAAGRPVLQAPQLPETCRYCTSACARLTFQLEEAKLRHAPFGPEIGR